MTENYTLLDCTLRDGGYYNNWDFEDQFVQRYLKAVEEVGISVVEIGFRFLPKKQFFGPYAYTSDAFLDNLDIPKKLTYGVMINAAEWLACDDPSLMIKKFFRPSKDSKISLVRIAINFNRALEAAVLSKELKLLGYIVGFNLMQAHGKDDLEYETMGKKIEAWETVDVLYFADSLGNMDPDEVRRISKSLKMGWPGDLGIHTHNNKGLALINTLAAIDAGVAWCDSTMTGMGRGAGNVQTENLVLELDHQKGRQVAYQYLYESVSDFDALKAKHNWGTNVYYHYAAVKNIHPTYVQELLSDNRYSPQKISNALNHLSSQSSSSFNKDSVNLALSGLSKTTVGSWNATDWLKGEDVLLVGAGPSVAKYKSSIHNLVKKRNLKVITLNANQHISEDLVHAIAISYVPRAAVELSVLSNTGTPLILPLGTLDDIIKDSLKSTKILDYGLGVDRDKFDFSETGCVLESSVSAAYAIAVITQANPKTIYMAGFDGFSYDDPRFSEMESILKRYSEHSRSRNLISLTPTKYSLSQDSIFSPEIYM